MEIFLAIKVIDRSISLFEIAGVFDTRDKAVLACVDDNYAYFKTEMNYVYPEITTYVSCCFPTKNITYMPDGSSVNGLL